ncbi:hypothetical protein NCPPB3778_75 [Rathayibacter phage NCPPB3778]|nr:hypothetical protein NCPPB3778_75 [Rathayibacter phage NCPPB3778]
MTATDISVTVEALLLDPRNSYDTPFPKAIEGLLAAHPSKKLTVATTYGHVLIGRNSTFKLSIKVLYSLIIQQRIQTRPYRGTDHEAEGLPKKNIYSHYLHLPITRHQIDRFEKGATPSLGTVWAYSVATDPHGRPLRLILADN